MKIIFWNIQGINGKRKKSLLHNKVSLETPYIVLLQETKRSNSNLNTILQKIWKTWQYVSLDARGFVEGMTILCNPSTMILENVFSNTRILTTQFRILGSKTIVFITNFYGPQQLNEKYDFLFSLQNIYGLIESHFLILGGDFNFISSLTEKTGGTRRLDPNSEAFNYFIQYFSLVDTNTINGIFTWNNRRGGTL